MSAHRKSASIDLATEPDLMLGGLRIRPSAREVLWNGQREVLEPRVMQVLVALARRRGEVVSKDRLIDECWAGRVVGDDAIGRCAARIRRLADAHGGFTLETIARVGYRLNERARDLEQQAPAPADTPRKPGAATVWLATGAAVVLAVLGAWRWSALRQARATDEVLLARASALGQQDRYGAAFTVLRDVHGQSDARVVELKRQIVTSLRLDVAEAGAHVSFKPYEDETGEWIPAGTFPFEQPIDAPVGALRVKVEKPGFRTEYFAVRNPAPAELASMPAAPPLPLSRVGALRDDMVLVPRTRMPVVLAGWTTSLLGGDQYDVPSFAIARFEVTNREYKEFVDANGYDEPAYWSDLKFTDEAGRELSWVEARARFVDATGRPGPAGWNLSTYPTGQADLPVGGISWYEAVAYARFRKAALPTIHHWLRAAMGPHEARPLVPAIATMSRFSADGPEHAHARQGLGPWGTYHMLGNVREWVWNRSGDDAVALGGAWSDYYGDAQIIFTTRPMSRAPQNGLRLMQRLPDDAALAAELSRPITRRAIDTARQPVSDAAFEAMRFQFTIRHAKPRRVNVALLDRTPPSVIEEVALEFDAMPQLALYIVRPAAPAGPLQPIIYGPAQNCCFARRPNREVLEQLAINRFIVEGGRALVMPIWLGSYDTFRPLDPDPEAVADRQRRAVLQWQQELSSTLDYLASREDMDSERIGFLGVSYGVLNAGGINLALEPRVRAAVFVSGGISVSPMSRHPMVDLVNYAPRIKIPVLMINGRFDHVFPYEQSQKRLFDLLGSPATHKAHAVIEAGHFSFAPNQIAMHSADWFDRHLGPVR